MKSNWLKLSSGKIQTMLVRRGEGFKELASSVTFLTDEGLICPWIVKLVFRVWDLFAILRANGCPNSHGGKHCLLPTANGQKTVSHPIGCRLPIEIHEFITIWLDHFISYLRVKLQLI